MFDSIEIQEVPEPIANLLRAIMDPRTTSDAIICLLDATPRSELLADDNLEAVTGLMRVCRNDLATALQF